MNKFVINNDTNISSLTMEKRIELLKLQVKESVGINITSEQALELNKMLSSGNIWVNDIYQVQHCVGEEIPEGWVRNIEDMVNNKRGFSMDYLSIKRRDKTPCRNWKHFQQIKNEICNNGVKRWAVEMYPPEKYLLNTSNQYHIWVFPENIKDLGFGMNTDNTNINNEKIKNGVVKNKGLNVVDFHGEKFTTGQGEFVPEISKID
jgi:hypothetical protein